jgi:small subunit ribosomal protein S16
MSLTIRLARQGAKKHPHYRVVVTDNRNPRDGRFLEWVGIYAPQATPAKVDLKLARIDDWIGKGAIPSPTVRAILKRFRATAAQPAP